MKVTRFPSNPGPAAWDAILPARDGFGALSAHETADWLVIGAGFAGLAAAHRLSQLCAGDKITVLDALRVGDGPAGRNTGFMIDLPHDLASSDYGGNVDADRATIARNRAAISFASDMVREWDLPDEALRKSGKINGAASIKGMHHNTDYAAHLDALGEPSEMLDAQQMQDVTGSHYYQGGLFTPGTVVLQPALFVRSVAQRLRSNRVNIYEKSAVRSLDRINGIWHARTDKGVVTAPKVILAVNGHAQSFGQFTRRLVHVYTYGSMTKAMDGDTIKRLGGQPNWGLTPADPLGSTVRRISGVEMEHRWGGHLCLSLNNVPAFGEVEEGLFSACCQNGLGTVQGTLGGMMAAELATGHTSDMLRDMLALDPPKRLPPDPFATLGARARLMWGEKKAGADL